MEQIISEDKKKKIEREYEDVYDIFLSQVQELSDEKNENIFNNMNLLIKKIILKLQQGLYKSKYNKEFNYDDKKFLSKKIKINDKQTLIQKLFFFEIEISEECKCKKTKYYQLKYYWEFLIKDGDVDSSEIISPWKKLEKKETCLKCWNELISKGTLISLPEYLLIFIDDKKYRQETAIDIKPFQKIKDKNVEYELTIFTNEAFYPVVKSNKDAWEYNLKRIRKLPRLMIYKRIKEKNKEK